MKKIQILDKDGSIDFEADFTTKEELLSIKRQLHGLYTTTYVGGMIEDAPTMCAELYSLDSTHSQTIYYEEPIQLLRPVCDMI